jgi:hypothetical protein
MQHGLESVFEALERNGVRYLVVGGVAVVLHGHLRTTQDLDLVLQLEPDNVRRALEALSALGFVPSAPVPLHAFANPEQRERWRREKGLIVFSLWSPKLPGFSVDLFAEEPFDFDVVHARAVRARLDRGEAVLIAKPDLIAMKRRAGRPLDLDDVDALTTLEDPPER